MIPKLRVEFHCHTEYSADSLTKIKQLISICKHRKIDRVVVTDHNTIKGALKAKEFAPELVIVGEEIMTQSGELLAVFVSKEVPAYLPTMEAITRLRDQNAFIIIPHPFDIYRSGSWEKIELEKIASHVDAIEIFNARAYSNRFNNRAKEFALNYGLQGTVGSDAHTLGEVGKATMLLNNFTGPDDLRSVLPDGGFDVSMSSIFIHLASRYAAFRKKFFNKKI
jgi:predicted metal-dependent phosphoesterase TrpH